MDPNENLAEKRLLTYRECMALDPSQNRPDALTLTRYKLESIDEEQTLVNDGYCCWLADTAEIERALDIPSYSTPNDWYSDWCNKTSYHDDKGKEIEAFEAEHGPRNWA